MDATANSLSERIVLVGAAIPQEVMDAVMKADRCPQVQTHKLSWAIIRGIESTGRVVDLISTIAMSDYPASTWLWCGYRKWDRANGSDSRLVPFINVLGLKQLTRFVGCLVLLIRWSVTSRRTKRQVILYGLISAHLYAVLFVKWCFTARMIVIITDLPAHASSYEPWWRRMLRPLDRWLVQSAVQRADGLITLTQQIADDFAPNVPAMVMEGIVSVESEEQASSFAERKRDDDKHFIIAYAGGLRRAYGLRLLLDAFALIDDEDVRLWLFGRGEMEDDIRHCAELDHRICFEGLVSPEQVFRKSQSATVLVNPRLSGESVTPYSFPSKLIEYMAAGRPVISTRLPGIPTDYDSYIVWLEHETPEGLAVLLRQLRGESRTRLDILGQRAQSFVLREKNCRRQGRRIVDFIGKLS